jgi:hypothetical protein
MRKNIITSFFFFLEMWKKANEGRGNGYQTVPLTFLTRESMTQCKQMQHKINESQQKIKINHMLNRASLTNNRLLVESHHRREDESHLK